MLHVVKLYESTGETAPEEHLVARAARKSAPTTGSVNKPHCYGNGVISLGFEVQKICWVAGLQATITTLVYEMAQGMRWSMAP